VAPLAPFRYQVQFTIGEETHDKLRTVQDLLRRELPDGDPAAIFDRALDLLLNDIARKKAGAADKPRPLGAAATRSRHIPAAIKRAVWLRDRGRCAFVSRSGRRCSARAYLEFHHVEPYAIGGETTANNISLRCQGHNAYEAELLFGATVSGEKAAWAGEGRTACGTRSGTSATPSGGRPPQTGMRTVQTLISGPSIEHAEIPAGGSQES